MMSKFLRNLNIIIYSNLILLSCLGIKKELYPIIGFSKLGYDFSILENKYRHIKINKSQNISSFVLHADSVEFRALAKFADFESVTPNGLVSTQVFISNKGDVESIIILESDDSGLNSIVIDAIQKIKFLPKKISKKKYEPYSIFIKYYFPGEDADRGNFTIYPIINGINVSKQNIKREKSDVYTIWEVDEPPSYLYKAEPSIPQNTSQRRIRGMTIMDIVIDEKGQVVDVAVVSSGGYFEQYSIDAAWRCKYRPGRVKGIPVKVTKRLYIIFD